MPPMGAFPPHGMGRLTGQELIGELITLAREG